MLTDALSKAPKRTSQCCSGAAFRHIAWPLAAQRMGTISPRQARARPMPRTRSSSCNPKMHASLRCARGLCIVNVGHSHGYAAERAGAQRYSLLHKAKLACQRHRRSHNMHVHGVACHALAFPGGANVANVSSQSFESAGRCSSPSFSCCLVPRILSCLHALS